MDPKERYFRITLSGKRFSGSWQDSSYIPPQYSNTANPRVKSVMRKFENPSTVKRELEPDIADSEVGQINNCTSAAVAETNPCLTNKRNVISQHASHVKKLKRIRFSSAMELESPNFKQANITRNVLKGIMDNPALDMPINMTPVVRGPSPVFRTFN